MDYMEIALEEANKALHEGEVPIGCVIVLDNKVIGRGHNRKEHTKCVTSHAEIIAIEEACRNINDWRLQNAIMYVTVEPCPMCMGAILQSRIERLYIGTFNKEMGACGTIIDLSEVGEINKFLDVIWEYDDRCSKLMSDFFKGKRN